MNQKERNTNIRTPRQSRSCKTIHVNKLKQWGMDMSTMKSFIDDRTHNEKLHGR